jgi:hypothetical protein
MEAFIKFAQVLQSLPQKQFERYVLIFLVGVSCLVGGVTYYIYSQSGQLVDRIKKLEELSNKSMQILGDNAKAQQEAQRIQELLDKDKDFNIKSYFETFYKEQGITPEPGWDTKQEEINERISEVSLSALFKGLSMEKLVKILSALGAKPVVYVKDIAIKSESNKKLNFELTIATRIIKKGAITK